LIFFQEFPRRWCQSRKISRFFVELFGKCSTRVHRYRPISECLETLGLIDMTVVIGWSVFYIFLSPFELYKHGEIFHFFPLPNIPQFWTCTTWWKLYQPYWMTRENAPRCRKLTVGVRGNSFNLVFVFDHMTSITNLQSTWMLDRWRIGRFFVWSGTIGSTMSSPPFCFLCMKWSLKIWVL